MSREPLQLATEQGELDNLLQEQGTPILSLSLEKATIQELREEKKKLTVAIMQMQKLIKNMPWANWENVYNQIGSRLEAVKSMIAVNTA